MGQFSLVHWLILGVVLVLVLGGGRFSNMMGDVAKGIKQFKKGMADEDEGGFTSGTPREPARLDTPRADAQKAAEPAFDRDGNKVREDR